MKKLFHLDQSVRARLNITFPVFNEALLLEQTIQTTIRFLERWQVLPFEVVIANNGSTDNTLSIAKRLSSEDPRIHVVDITAKGRGRALKEVWRQSTAEILSYMDCDLSTDLNDFPKLVTGLTEGMHDIAVGSRLLRDSKTIRGIRREIISRLYNLLIKLLFRTSFSDAQCGFKALTKEVGRELLPLIEDNEWFADTELLILGEKLGYRILDVPVRWVDDDTDSKVKILSTAISDLNGLLRLKRNFARGRYNKASPNQSQ